MLSRQYRHSTRPRTGQPSPPHCLSLHDRPTEPPFHHDQQIRGEGEPRHELSKREQLWSVEDKILREWEDLPVPTPLVPHSGPDDGQPGVQYY